MRLGHEHAASHNLNRLLDKPGSNGMEVIENILCLLAGCDGAADTAVPL